MVMVILMSYR